MMNHWLVFRSFTIAPRSSISNTNISVSVFISSAMASWQRLLPFCRTSSSVYARFLGTSTLNLATIFLSPFHWMYPAVLPRVGRRRPFRVSILYLRDRVCRSVLRSLKSRFSYFSRTTFVYWWWCSPGYFSWTSTGFSGTSVLISTSIIGRFWCASISYRVYNSSSLAS